MPRPEWAPQSAAIPEQPGVYRYTDQAGTVIYVGKAKNLRRRITDYYETSQARTLAMLERARNVEWTVAGSETDALVLERAWINSFDPPYNIKLRHSGHGARLVLTKGPVPRLNSTYRPGKEESWGPWPGGHTEDLLQAVGQLTGVATCSAGRYKQAKASKRACLLLDLGRCQGPCVNALEDYSQVVDATRKLLNGGAGQLVEQARSNMLKASEEQAYEVAARFRDQIKALEVLSSKQTIIADRPYNFDVAWVEEAVQPGWAIVSVRGGVVSQVRTGTALNSEYAPGKDPVLAVAEELAQSSMDSELKYTHPSVPGHHLPKSSRSGRAAAVQAAAALAQANAREAVKAASWRLRSDATTRSAAATELGELLALTQPTWRIAAVDIAHVAGTNAFAGVAVLQDGIPTASFVWKVPVKLAGDDFASISWAVRKAQDKNLQVDLLVVDGGPGQLAAAAKDLKEGHWPLVSLAKRMEEVFLPGQEEPLILARSSKALALLQAARDAAHKTCNRATRKSHARTGLLSELESVPGMGRKRAALLAQTFPSKDALKAASAADFSALPGIGPKLAEQLVASFGGPVPKSGLEGTVSGHDLG